MAAGTPDLAGLPILLVGEKPIRSAPCRTLAAALSKQGISSTYSDGAEEHTLPWLHLVRRCSAVLLTEYHGPDLFGVRQLALAVGSGTPIVRWWVGTDVLNCTQKPEAGRGARLLSRIVSRDVAAAPHLVDELAGIGITATFVPSVIERDLLSATGEEASKSLLVYLPSSSREFYGYDIVRRAVVANPDLTFVIVADETHALKTEANVVSLGWVDDMTTVWPRVGGLLRVTQHDGMPRMVLEALLQAKHVIYSWPFPGCWLAKSADEVQKRLKEFRAIQTPNFRGVEEVVRLQTPEPAQVFARMLREAREGLGPRPRLIAGAMAVWLTAKLKLNRLQSV